MSDEYLATLYPKNLKRKFSYILNHTFKIEDGLNEKYYTKLAFKVPTPRTADDLPVVLVALWNAKKSLFLTFSDVKHLASVFNLKCLSEAIAPEDLEEELTKALAEAELWRAIRADLEKQAAKEFHEHKSSPQSKSMPH